MEPASQSFLSNDLSQALTNLNFNLNTRTPNKVRVISYVKQTKDPNGSGLKPISGLKDKMVHDLTVLPEYNQNGDSSQPGTFLMKGEEYNFLQPSKRVNSYSLSPLGISFTVSPDTSQPPSPSLQSTPRHRRTLSTSSNKSDDLSSPSTLAPSHFSTDPQSNVPSRPSSAMRSHHGPVRPDRLRDEKKSEFSPPHPEKPPLRAEKVKEDRKIEFVSQPFSSSTQPPSSHQPASYQPTSHQPAISHPPSRPSSSSYSTPSPSAPKAPLTTTPHTSERKHNPQFFIFPPNSSPLPPTPATPTSPSTPTSARNTPRSSATAQPLPSSRSSVVTTPRSARSSRSTTPSCSSYSSSSAASSASVSKNPRLMPYRNLRVSNPPSEYTTPRSSSSSSRDQVHVFGLSS